MSNLYYIICRVFHYLFDNLPILSFMFFAADFRRRRAPPDQMFLRVYTGAETHSDELTPA